MSRALLTPLLLLLTLPLAACDAAEPVCNADMACDRDAESIPPQDPEPVDPANPPATQDAAYCDADVLDGLSCDCGGLSVDVLTHQGEIVSDGEASLVLHAAGSGALSNFDVCRDYYRWEDGGSGCALVLIRTDAGCGGLALQQLGGAAGEEADCPYVAPEDLATVCEPAS